MTRKLFSVLIAICIVIGVLPFTAIAVDAEATYTTSDGDKKGSFLEAIANVADGGTITLLKNIEVNGTVTLPISKSFTLLGGGYEVKITNGSIIIEGSAVVYLGRADYSETLKIYSTHNQSSIFNIQDSAELYIYDNVTLGPSTCFNSAGGIHLSDDAELHMYGGTITDCNNPFSICGGVAVTDRSKFYMHGGTIQNCTGVEGGAISIHPGPAISGGSHGTPTFEMTGGTICVPLINKYEVIGCIQIINKKDGSLYNDADVDLCENLAMLTAIAIDDKGLNLGFAEEKKSIISLRGVTKVFGQGDTQIQILKGVNLDVREGEFLVILGESGCGKSTMLNIIGGMDKLTGGSFLFDGVDYSNADEKTLTMYRRHSVGFIFQAYNLMPTLTAKENLEFIGELCEDPMDAEDALERVGLLGRKDNYPSQMSGGQQQRVSIARALMKKPRLILADEPTAALDYETSIEVLTVLEDVIKAGTTMLMVTHNEEIAKMANRVIRMKGGVVAEVIVNRHPAAAKELVW